MNNIFSFKGIGTQWEIEIYSPITSTQLEYLKDTIKTRVEQFEQTYSRFRPDSFINSTLMQTGVVKLPADAEKLFAMYQELYTATGGLFTPLIGQVLVEAGYDSEYSLVPKKLHTPPPWEETAEVSYPFINIKKSAAYDFGAAGKGHLIDIVSQIIIEQGFPEFCVDAGKDILLNSRKPIRVGLENPLNFKEAIGVVTLTKGSICASAGSRRSWSTYHHIINPRTLTSPNKILATWVIAPDALLADALSTCLFLVPSKKLMPYFSFEYLILYEDNSIEKSSSFSSEFFFK